MPQRSRFVVLLHSAIQSHSRNERRDVFQINWKNASHSPCLLITTATFHRSYQQRNIKYRSKEWDQYQEVILDAYDCALDRDGGPDTSRLVKNHQESATGVVALYGIAWQITLRIYSVDLCKL
jgi:hypothetical protein